MTDLQDRLKYEPSAVPGGKHRGFVPGLPVVCMCLAVLAGVFSGCASGAAQAEEYYTIGMAYYEMGKFQEAEQWLNRAKAADKTKTASEYNLGRIAYETGRFEDAAGYFENIIKKDPENVPALKAAAYTRIKTGDIDKAEAHYQKVLALVPESADEGYNYALVLYAMKKYSEAEKVLAGYPYALQDNRDTLLLYARSQKAQGKAEAVDSYAKWLAGNSDSQVRYEYAQFLETQELYARALEEYRLSYSNFQTNNTELKRQDIRFALGRLLLIADGENAEGITELEGAVSEGYDNIKSMEDLLEDKRIGAAHRESLRAIITGVREAAEAAAKAGADADAAAKEKEEKPTAPP